jgi:flavin-dependent dehydrogenase
MTQAIVIGGGLAGAAMAIRLASAGRDVTLLERESGPVDKVCGEFLSREATMYLAGLGLDLTALGAVRIDAVRWCAPRHTAETPLPFSALSLSRRVLDEALLQRASAAGATVRRGAKVTALTRQPTGWVTQLGDGSALSADAVFLATGKHDLRGHQRSKGFQNDLVAFKMHYRLLPRHAEDLGRHVELVPFHGGYAGLQPIEQGLVNLCLLVRRARFHELGQRWERLLAAIRSESPHLDARLVGAGPLWARPLALASIPYGYLRQTSDGLWRLGDQAAVVPSFSGDGMSIALHSAQLAARTFLQGGSADDYQRQLASDVKGQMVLATALSLGMVRRPVQSVLGAVARVWPGLMSTVAFHTRVSDAALARSLSWGTS